MRILFSIISALKQLIGKFFRIFCPFEDLMTFRLFDPHSVLIIMEYAENGTVLDFLMDLNDGLIEAIACKYFKQLISAIDYCHSKNIVHRDLKLENLLLDRFFNLKLVDFGFARKMHANHELSQTFCGSNGYASPEILKSTPYDPKMSDCWAVGVILFAMVFGQLPFDDKNGVPDLIHVKQFSFFLYKSNIYLDFSCSKLNEVSCFQQNMCQRNPNVSLPNYSPQSTIAYTFRQLKMNHGCLKNMSKEPVPVFE